MHVTVQPKNRGFTLIELLVVISIIALLASITLASLKNARDKASDVAIKANLNNTRSQAELYRANNADSYGVSSYPSTGIGICSSAVVPVGAGIYQMLQAADVHSPSVSCDSVAGAWAAQAQLIASANFYCVDSTGKVKINSVSKGVATACP